MERVVRGRSATLYHTFYANGVPTNPLPDAATVTVTRDDGTVVTSAAATVDEPTAGMVSYTLNPTETGMLDRLSVVWTASFGGQSQTFVDVVEIVGGVYFTIADARANGLADTVAYTVGDIVSARTAAEQAIEEECGLAFVPRYDRATVNGDNTYGLRLPWPMVRAIRWAKVTGVTRDVTAVTYGGSGYVYDTSWWPYGNSNITVGFEHGYDLPPEGVKRAALDYARQLVSAGSANAIDPRAERLITDDGTIVFGSGSGGRFSSSLIESALAPYRMPTIL